MKVELDGAFLGQMKTHENIQSVFFGVYHHYGGSRKRWGPVDDVLITTHQNKGDNYDH